MPPPTALDARSRPDDACPSAAPARRRAWRVHALAVLGFAALALAFSWPLPLHLATHLLGPPTSDMGVYVWNIWVFQHELLDHHQFPLFTSTILSLTTPADLSLHNYTVFANLLALPLVRLIGVIATFNTLYLAISVLTAYTMFLLAREVVGSDAEAWLAGVVLAFSPALVARGTGHLSLVAAAPIPLFVLLLMRAERGSRGAMTGAGATLAWAAYCDPYYGVYCFALGAWHLGSRVLVFARRSRADGPRGARERRWLDAGIVIAGAVAAGIAVTGGGRLHLAGLSISMTGLYTPVLVLTLLVATRLLVTLRPRIGVRLGPEARNLLRLAPWGVMSSTVLLSPVVYALLVRVAEGRFVAPKIYWRTSTPGIDLLALVTPNPNHPLLHPLLGGWFAAQNGGYIENVASLTFVVLAVLTVAMWAYRARQPWYWAGLALTAASLALGPFVRIAGIETYVPTPWALLRYVPVIGSARAPARFMVVVMMAVAVLFACALRAIVRPHPGRRGLLLAGVALALVLNLWPAPRPLFLAKAPSIYDRIASDPRDVRVLEIPFGVRDGLMSAGDFNAVSQLYQTRHHKPIIGGYLSRISAQRVDAVRSRPVLAALMLLSENRPVPPDLAAQALARGPLFIERAQLGYVVIDRSRASAQLTAFAVKVLRLDRIDQDGDRELYAPRLAGPSQATVEAR